MSEFSGATSAGIGRQPLWSVMIPTFNNAAELPLAIESVLGQDPGADQMQICVIDDCSTRDNPEKVVAELGRGRIEFRRQERNGGNGRTFNSCLDRACGQLVHILHGDDWVLPGFYSTMTRLFQKHPDAGMAFCRHYYSSDEMIKPDAISPLEQPEEGILNGWFERLAIQQRTQYVATVVRKTVYESVGPFQTDMPNCEDWEMWMRIAQKYPVGFSPQPLAVYRIHSGNLSSTMRRTGADIANARRAIQLFSPLIPPHLRPQLAGQAYRRQASWALTLAQGYAGKGDLSTSCVQFREALKTSVSWMLWPQFFRSGCRIVAHSLRLGLGIKRAQDIT